MKIRNKKKSRFGYLAFYIFRYSKFDILYSRTAGGFTIVETLVAVAILALAVTGPLALAERGLVAARESGQEVAAFYLAQEAFEFVRNMRDGNMLTGGGQSWLKGLGGCIVDKATETKGGCGVDATAEKKNEQIVSCDGDNNDCTLSQHMGVYPYENLKGIYGYPENRNGPNSDLNKNWVRTAFRRKVFINEIVKNEEVNLRVSIFWRSVSGRERSFTVSGSMFNWYAP